MTPQCVGTWQQLIPQCVGTWQRVYLCKVNLNKDNSKLFGFDLCDPMCTTLISFELGFQPVQHKFGYTETLF